MAEQKNTMLPCKEYGEEAKEMPKIIIEPGKRSGYVGIQNKQIVARGSTQGEAGKRSHRKDPSATVEAARVRTTENGKPDEFLVLYHGKKHKKQN